MSNQSRHGCCSANPTPPHPNPTQLDVYNIYVRDCSFLYLYAPLCMSTLLVAHRSCSQIHLPVIALYLSWTTYLAFYWPYLAFYWPVTVPNEFIGMLIELRNVRMCYIFYILYTPYPSTLAKSPSQSWAPQEFYDLATVLGLYSDPQMRLRPGFALASLPREALTSPLRVPFTLQVTCDPQDSIVGIPPSKGVIHGSCGSNLVLLACCCYAAMLLCFGIPIFGTAPAPQLLKQYHFYLLTI